jgi:outer membrane protein OmpA-like peptidoglycan-associated protein
MRILILGFLIFSAWAAISTHIYVCKIKGFCFVPKNDLTVKSDFNSNSTLSILFKNAIQENTIFSNNLIIYFAPNKSKLSPNVDLEKYLKGSISYLNRDLNVNITIIGHTDSIGTKIHNQSLGLLRAKFVQHYYESRGIPENRIQIISKGELMPIDANNTAKGRANNRRIEITYKKLHHE